MAVSVENLLPVPYRIVGNQKKVVKKITFDNSYESEGEPLSAETLGLRVIESSDCNLTHGSESATLRPTSAEWKEGKIHLIDSATGKEVESTKDMSKVVVQIEAYGW